MGVGVGVACVLVSVLVGVLVGVSALGAQLLTMPLPPTEWFATTDTVYAGCPMRLQYEYSSPSYSSPVPLEVSCGEPAAAVTGRTVCFWPGRPSSARAAEKGVWV